MRTTVSSQVLDLECIAGILAAIFQLIRAFSNQDIVLGRSLNFF